MLQLSAHCPARNLSKPGFTWIAALIGWLIIAALSGNAQENSTELDNTSPENPPARIARISYLKGNVSVLRSGVDQWSSAALNFPATTGDRIYTDREARAELEIGPYTVRLSQTTDLTLTDVSDQVLQLGLQQGTIRLSAYDLPSGNTVEIDTPNGTLTVRQAGKYRIDTNPDNDQTDVTVDSGSVEITGGDLSQVVEAGQAVRLIGHDPIEVESVPMPGRDDFDAWSEERDRRLAESTTAKYVSPSTPGYSDLDEYGHWKQEQEYGPVWYPPVAVGWVPYRVGSWIWVDPWGWTWIEDEPWGFCPFHYGRWVLIGATWGWVPGPIVALPIYAPAFVAFLGGSGFSIGIGIDLVAWFPLGPGEPFFPWYHHSDDYLRLVNITNIRNVTNITNITNITNVNNVHYKYQTVAATAVPRNAFATGQPVTRHVVRVNPSQLAKAQITPHPPVNPTPRAVIPKPVSTPPVRAVRPVSVVGKQPAGTRPPGTTRTAAPPNTARQTAPPLVSGRTPPPIRQPGSTSRSVAPPMISRRPPPPPVVPFEQRRPPMLAHPGRPLEPAQVDDLRAARPVRPMHDVEFPPHPPTVVHERPAPSPRPARSRDAPPKQR